MNSQYSGSATSNIDCLAAALMKASGEKMESYQILPMLEYCINIMHSTHDIIKLLSPHGWKEQTALTLVTRFVIQSQRGQAVDLNPSGNTNFDAQTLSALKDLLTQCVYNTMQLTAYFDQISNSVYRDLFPILIDILVRYINSLNRGTDEEPLVQ